MDIQTAPLPTPLSQVVRRLNVCGPNDSAEKFLVASYVAEIAIKLLGVSLANALKFKAHDHSYRMCYDFVRADGLGVWEANIRQAISYPLAGYLPHGMNELIAWATKVRTKPEDGWFRDTSAHIQFIFESLGLDSPIPERKPTVNDLITSLVQIRNKTKAHGAVGIDFFSIVNENYISIIQAFLSQCPLFKWKWLHLEKRENGRNRGIWLLGTDPFHAKDSEVASLPVSESGVYFWPEHSIHPISISNLVISNRECTWFLVPNGSYSTNGSAIFIDYYNGTEDKQNVAEYSRPPIALPPSETEGLSSLIVQSNILGNLPDLPQGYIDRVRLEDELFRRLKDQNHTIITLHGRGGIGKTSLALKVSHSLSHATDPIFEHIIWFSARDVDLQSKGPSSVQPDVISLDEVSKVYGNLMGYGTTIEDFSLVLQEADPVTKKGTLFIFDNFETMSDPLGTHQFLDTYTHLPNKILITSRERAFKADFPIEVQGMDSLESKEMMVQISRDLLIETLINTYS